MIYTFEDYSLDPARRELRRGEELIAVEPQVFDVLHFLITHREQVVSNDDLIAAVWNGRIVSESTLATRINAVRRAVGDSGENQRLIRTVPRKGHRFVGEVGEHRSDGAFVQPLSDMQSQGVRLRGQAAPPSQLPDKPSIAVLPFANLSGDAEQEYFADGITEDIITALSYFRWLFVIARSSSFTYRGRAVDIKQVARELGVRYVLEGSVRKAMSRTRITAQLIDAATGAHLWANRFDGDDADIFKLQDQVTASAVGAIAPKLEQAEIERAKRKPTENLDAYDHYLRGMASTVPYTKEGTDEALGHFYRAIELDPEFAAAHGMGAWCFVHRKTHGWMKDRGEEIAETTRLARRAVELGSDDANALAWGGFALAYVAHEVDDGVAYVDQALVLNPNLATAWASSGWLRVYLGQPDEAIGRLEQAMHLSPLDSLIFRVHAGIAYAHLFAGRHDRAVAWAERAIRARPNYLTAVRGLAAAYVFSGRLDEARKMMTHMRGLDPALRISNLADLLPLRQPHDAEKWMVGLRKAGLPE